MRKPICYKCGNPAYRDNLCKECYERQTLPRQPRIKAIRVCSSCGKTFHPKLRTFLPISPSEMMEEVYGISGEETRTRFIYHIGSEEKSIPILRQMCLVCSRKAGNYHEAKIQLRDGLDFLVDFIPEDSIVRIEEKKEGLDVLILDKASAKSFISMIRDKYRIIFSRKLVGERNGKRIYRDTYAVRKWKK